MILLKISSIVFHLKGCQKGPHFVQKNPPVEVSGYGLGAINCVKFKLHIIVVQSRFITLPNFLWLLWE